MNLPGFSPRAAAGVRDNFFVAGRGKSCFAANEFIHIALGKISPVEQTAWSRIRNALAAKMNPGLFVARGDDFVCGLLTEPFSEVEGPTAFLHAGNIRYLGIVAFGGGWLDDSNVILWDSRSQFPLARVDLVTGEYRRLSDLQESELPLPPVVQRQGIGIAEMLYADGQVYLLVRLHDDGWALLVSENLGKSFSLLRSGPEQTFAMAP